MANIAGGLLLLCTMGTAQAAIPASERLVLDALYSQTNGASWVNKTGWGGASGTECFWFGITCDPGQTHVTKVSLGGNNLTGTLPTNLNNLTDLEWLHLGANHLTGPIPSFNGWSKLKTLKLYGNKLTGSVPPLSDLTALQHLELQDNQLTGSFPSLNGLSNLARIYIYSNRFTGAMPPPPSPNSLAHPGSGLCPNFFNRVSNSEWDAAGYTRPWYQDCTASPVNAVADAGTAMAGTASTAVAVVRVNDTVNGVAATAANSTIAMSGVWPAGIALDPATGAIQVAATVSVGTYTVTYQLCDLGTPITCQTVDDSVTVTPGVTPLADNGTVLSGTGGPAVPNVRANDTIGAAPATAANSTIAIVGAWPAGISLDTATGAIQVATTVPPGTYTVSYQLCDTSTPANCNTAADTVTVTASINPVADTGAATAGSVGTAVTNVRANDTVNGAVATAANSTIAAAGTWPAGITLDTVTGAIQVAATVPAGTYSVSYQLCDKSTPANCSTATDTITVSALVGIPAVTIAKTANPASGVKVGDLLTYTITVNNTGTVQADGTVVADSLPAALSSASWTCTASGGAVCPTASGTGSFTQTVATLPVNGQVIYTVKATVSKSGGLSNTAQATPPDGQGGLGATMSATANVAEAAAIPTLQQWALALLSLLLAGAGFAAQRRASH